MDTLGLNIESKVLYMEKTSGLYVIIPVYNCIRYLGQAVESILAQPKENIRICIVDDGSTDGTAELCDRLAAKSSKIHVLHQVNAGVSAARNNGIDYVLSVADIYRDYIVFCDADDIWLPNAITDDTLPTSQDYDMYIFNMVGSSQDLSRHRILTAYQDEDILDTPSIIWDMKSYFVSHLYACKLIATYGIRFPVRTKYVEDRMFDSICIYLSRKIRRCSRYLYSYRYNSSSAMHTKHKVSKIDFYSQVIDGWIETDHIINSWSDKTGKYSHMGYTLASIHFMDLAAEHYQNWGSRKVLDDFFRNHPYYYLFEEMAEASVSPKQYREHLMMKNHHLLFQLKHNVFGLVRLTANTVFRIPMIKSWYIKRKYTADTLPVNK